MNYESWTCLTEETLKTRDIAQLNLAAACGLPFADDLDVPKLSAQVDDWAAVVEHATKRMNYRRSRYKQYTDGQFRMLLLVTVLQRDLGVHYNLPFSEGEYDASDSRNHFLHGLLQGHGGTCVTMPVLYIAIGRRLGYPLFLVKAKEHLFCRWQGQGDRFNIEATSPGFVSLPDDEYLRFPKRLSSDDLQTGVYLHNLTRVEEVAHFAAERGNCCLDNLWTWAAFEAYATSDKLAPSLANRNHIAMTVLIHEVLSQRMPEVLGPMPGGARFPDLPNDWRRGIEPHAQEYLRRILANRQGNRLATMQMPTANDVSLRNGTGVYYA